MPSSTLVLVLVAGMLLTGSSNTLLTKYQDQLCVRNCDDPDTRNHEKFEQPVIQTLQMFIGEMGCWILVGLFTLFEKWNERRKRGGAGYEPVGGTDNMDAVDNDEDAEPREQERQPLRRRSSVKAMEPNPNHPELRGTRVLLLALPAICDICGTTLMNVGLLFVAASIYQMTRGALVLFVGLFSVVFLKRHLFAFQWFALFVVVLGVAVVGLSGALYHSKDTIEDLAKQAVAMATDDLVLRAVIGVLLIAFAQVFTATQFVLEEYILEKYALAPLKVVGWEGIFGFSVTVIGMIVLHLAIGRTEAGRYGYFDAKEGLKELSQSDVALSSFLIMISIGAFNFFGISVTRSVSATARSVIDTSRTLVIWIISLSLGWEKFTFLQLFGFALLVYGTFLFNRVISPPLKACMPREEPEELLPEEPIEHM